MFKDRIHKIIIRHNKHMNKTNYWSSEQCGSESDTSGQI